MIDWFFTTLKTYPEIAIFLALALGYYFGKFTYKGIGLGSVTATLIAAVVIGQIGITVNQPLKAFSFLMFLFAVGYAVGPQFVGALVARDLGDSGPEPDRRFAYALTYDRELVLAAARTLLHWI